MGPGLLESVYELCLLKEFELRGLEIHRGVAETQSKEIIICFCASPSPR